MSRRLPARVPGGESIPHVRLGTLPTPVVRHERLCEAVGVPDLYVKHDGQTGDLYGGNKVRKLEFLLGDALERDHTGVWTGGGIGSNHVLATSLYAREVSLRPHAVHFPQPVTEHVRENLRALSTAEPTLKLVSGELRAAIEAARLKAARRLHPDPSAYYIPPGGASPIGELGYVNAALEIQSQVAAGELPEPDVIVVAVGTGGTMAGLLIGCRLASLECSVLGVRVAQRLFANRFRIARLANRTAGLLSDHGVRGLSPVRPGDVTIADGYVGDGYGVATPEARRMTGVARECGLELEGTFTAKAVAALEGERDARSLDERTVLYLHTYNEVDVSDRVAAADPLADLPPSYRQFF